MLGHVTYPEALFRGSAFRRAALRNSLFPSPAAK
jgi:hypothetical protein